MLRMDIECDLEGVVQEDVEEGLDLVRSTDEVERVTKRRNGHVAESTLQRSHMSMTCGVYIGGRDIPFVPADERLRPWDCRR